MQELNVRQREQLEANIEIIGTLGPDDRKRRIFKIKRSLLKIHRYFV